LAPSSARVAEQLGYTNVKVFHAGMPAWKKADGLLISKPDYLKTLISKEASYVLVDLRDKKTAEKGHLLGAVSVPAGKLPNAKALFPEDKSAPIILYTASGHDEKSYQLVKSWGYKNVSVLDGGVDQWVKSQGRLFTNGLPETIKYVKKVPKGEITIAEFEKVAKATPADKLILDVRDTEATANGMLASAKHIPQAEVANRLAELPKDKEILIHCNTGILASMTHEVLAKNGYNARFLNAVVQVDKNGGYEISEK
jgi:rhodanese-related sulfurtransferase